MIDFDLDDKITIYKLFWSDEITREHAEKLIGEDWERVAETASIEIGMETQEIPDRSKFIDPAEYDDGELAFRDDRVDEEHVDMPEEEVDE